MPDLAVTPNRVSPVTDIAPRQKFYRAGVELTAGQLVRLGADGLIYLGSNGNPNDLVGITTGPAQVGEAVSVLFDGTLYGFDLSNVPCGARLYTSTTLGAIADMPPTSGSRNLGTAVVTTERPPQKVLYVGIGLVPR